MLYEDIDNDQQFWNVIAGLVLSAPPSRPST